MHYLVVIILLGLSIGAPYSEAEEGACAAAPPRLEPPPVPESEPPAPAFSHPRYQDSWGWFENGFWGVGFLESATELSPDWIHKIVLPLYASPGGRHAGWLNRGWVQQDETVPISPYASVETGYEIPSLILADVREDGWLGLRLTDAAPSAGGIVWTHACRLDFSDARLEIVQWRDVFRGERVGSVFFRSRVPHALRAEPSTQSPRLMWIGKRDDLEVLEVQGDWMRVRAFQPGKYFTLCDGAAEWSGISRVGWVRWWSEEKGTWLRYPTRGC